MLKKKKNSKVMKEEIKKAVCKSFASVLFIPLKFITYHLIQDNFSSCKL